mmetsp:Transcript_3411/g.5316  ORF Transcript_3411/g.5316 Transcript_3411/m.5316 type:complete len:176 (-) Transcript_3411:996-1523(-)
MEAFCNVCENTEPVELVEPDGKLVFCTTCGDEFEYDFSNNANDASSSPYDNFKIGMILSVEPIAKQKDLKKVMVDVIGGGDEEEAIPVVTNAKYVDPGWRVVVALEIAIVPAGSNLVEDTGVIQVKSTSVGGIMSRGMLCDSPMLGWTGGAKGQVQQLPDICAVGDTPPSERPRV